MKAGGQEAFFDPYTEKAIRHMKEVESRLQEGGIAMRFGASTFIWESPFGDDKLHLAHRVAGLGFDTLEICIEDPARVSADAVRRRPLRRE